MVDTHEQQVSRDLSEDFQNASPRSMDAVAAAESDRIVGLMSQLEEMGDLLASVSTSASSHQSTAAMEQLEAAMQAKEAELSAAMAALSEMEARFAAAGNQEQGTPSHTIVAGPGSTRPVVVTEPTDDASARDVPETTQRVAELTAELAEMRALIAAASSDPETADTAAPGTRQPDSAPHRLESGTAAVAQLEAAMASKKQELATALAELRNSQGTHQSAEKAKTKLALDLGYTEASSAAQSARVEDLMAQLSEMRGLLAEYGARSPTAAAENLKAAMAAKEKELASATAQLQALESRGVPPANTQPSFSSSTPDLTKPPPAEPPSPPATPSALPVFMSTAAAAAPSQRGNQPVQSSEPGSPPAAVAPMPSFDAWQEERRDYEEILLARRVLCRHSKPYGSP